MFNNIIYLYFINFSLAIFFSLFIKKNIYLNEQNSDIVKLINQYSKIAIIQLVSAVNSVVLYIIYSNHNEIELCDVDIILVILTIICMIISFVISILWQKKFEKQHNTLIGPISSKNLIFVWMPLMIGVTIIGVKDILQYRYLQNNLNIIYSIAISIMFFMMVFLSLFLNKKNSKKIILVYVSIVIIVTLFFISLDACLKLINYTRWVIVQ